MDDNMGGVENSEHGHEYQSKMGETVTMNSLDIHVVDQVIEYSFQHGGVLGGSAEFGDSRLHIILTLYVYLLSYL